VTDRMILRQNETAILKALQEATGEGPPPYTRYVTRRQGMDEREAVVVLKALARRGLYTYTKYPMAGWLTERGRAWEEE